MLKELLMAGAVATLGLSDNSVVTHTEAFNCADLGRVVTLQGDGVETGALNEIQVTLNRSNPNYQLMEKDRMGFTSGRIYGPAFTVISTGTRGVSARYIAGDGRAIGLNESSSGTPRPGEQFKFHSTIDPSQFVNGSYPVKLMVMYSPEPNVWCDGQEVRMNLTLED